MQQRTKPQHARINLSDDRGKLRGYNRWVTQQEGP
jgi:hypothetical protein